MKVMEFFSENEFLGLDGFCGCLSYRRWLRTFWIIELNKSEWFQISVEDFI
jgi:hypothetical protein